MGLVGNGSNHNSQNTISRHGSLEIEFERRPFSSSNYSTNFLTHNSTSIHSLSTHSKSTDVDTSKYGFRSHVHCDLSVLRANAPSPIAPPPTHREEEDYEELQYQQQQQQQQQEQHMMTGVQEVDELSPNQVTDTTQTPNTTY